MLPIVKLLAVPEAVLKRRVFRISIFAVPTLIELNAPAAVKTKPIEALLIMPANNVPIVKVLAEPDAVLKRRVFRISVFIMLAVKSPVLSKVVLKTGGTKDIPPLPPTIPVSKDPSPTKRPNTVPVEIVEKKPKEVDIVTAEILDTTRR